jgi:hypothetical protein
MAMSLATAIVLQGCAGRTANPIPQYQPGDERRACEPIKKEIASNEFQIVKRLPGTDNVDMENWILGISGVFFFYIPWMFMDIKQADSMEIQAFRRRNAWLREMASTQDFLIPPTRIKLIDKPPKTASPPTDMPDRDPMD